MNSSVKFNELFFGVCSGVTTLLSNGISEKSLKFSVSVTATPENSQSVKFRSTNKILIIGYYSSD